MSWGVSPWVYPVWDSLDFLDLGDYFLPHFREVFNYYLLKDFLMIFLSSSSGTPIIRMLECFILSWRSLRLSSFLFPLLGIHTEETRIERDTCTPMVIAALFIIARTWKQPRCPSDEWIQKLWYIYTMECYSVIKKNTFESVLMRWMKLEPIIQSE